MKYFSSLVDFLMILKLNSSPQIWKLLFRILKNLIIFEIPSKKLDFQKPSTSALQLHNVSLHPPLLTPRPLPPPVSQWSDATGSQKLIKATDGVSTVKL